MAKRAWKAVALTARAIIRHPLRAAGALLRVLWACRVSVASVVIPAWILIKAPQGRDLFSYFASPMTPGSEPVNIGGGEALTILYWAAMAGLTWAFWAYPVHASARIILYSPDWLFRQQIVSASHIRRLQLLYRPLIVWVPRILGAGPFLALSLACSSALPDVPGPHLGAIGPPDTPEMMSGSSREIVLMLQFLRVVFIAAAIFFVIYLTFFRSHGMVRPSLDAPILPRSQPLRRRYREAIGDGGLIAADVAQSRILLSMVTFTLIAVLLAPSFFTRFLFLALVVPVVAGAWVPFFTWLTLRGQKSRLPLTTLALAILAVLVYFFGDNHDVSRSEVKAVPRPSFSEAVALWKAANQCDGGPCPRPIIVASAGGASRAAFFTLTVLGDLMDNPAFDALPELKTPAEKARFVANRIFAISGVSGGAVGAVFYSAALANSPDGTPPCAARTSSNWFRAGPPRGWRDCLQVMLAEDYLSETIIGLGFRDNLNFIDRLVHWPDRAAILERSWTRALAGWIRPEGQRNVQGLDQPFSFFAPRQGAPWQPLLILNGTSVSTGRRILTSHLAFKPLGNQRLFVDAYDLYEIFSGRRHCEPGGCKEELLDINDIPLATAATNSARFPIISPPGTLRRNRDQTSDNPVVDRIVDGGYFENDGITTTIDLVRALCEASLCPVVLHIANDPLPYPREAVGEVELGAPELPRAEDRSWLLFIRGPLGSLFATRSARASYALGEVLQELRSEDDFAEVLVYGEPLAGFPPLQSDSDREPCIAIPATSPETPLKQVSMSWWLSQPVQEYIDAQLKLRRNCVALDRVRGWLTSAPH